MWRRDRKEGEKREGVRWRKAIVGNCRAQTLTDLEGVGFNNSLCVVCGVWCVVCGGKGGGRGHNHTNVCTVNTMVVPSTHSRVISIHVNLSWEKMKERERGVDCMKLLTQ